MTDATVQIALAMGVPTLAVLISTLVNNSRLSDLRAHVDSQFANVDAQFANVDRRFDEMRDMWRSELRRVEEVVDARLKHLER